MPPPAVLWFLVAGALLILMALSGSVLKRLPLSSSVLYLLAGVGIGPHGWHLIQLDLVRDAHLLEVLSEVAILISLFTAGLNLAPPLSDKRWHIPLRLATVSMVLTVGLLTVIGVYLLNLPVGAAVLLGAILAPTDPVLASDVTVEHHEDRDRLRFGLTGEAGINDGSAFPFIMLGLGLLGLHSIGLMGGRWLAVDVVWSVVVGLGSGYGLGWLLASLVLYLRKEHKEAVGLDEFLTLGLIAFANGFALLLHSYGFLAVFAAGLALRRVEQHQTQNAVEVEQTEEESSEEESSEEESSEEESSEDESFEAESGQIKEEDKAATDPKQAPAHLAHTLISFNERLEHIGEMVLMVLVGTLLDFHNVPFAALWFVPLLFLLVRPIAVLTGLIGSRTSRIQRGLIAWFGIRGIGSVYYLTYAIGHGIPEPLARTLIGLVLSVITTSVFVHGISVTPLMNRYKQKGAPK